MHSDPLTRVYSHWPFQLNRRITLFCFSILFFHTLLFFRRFFRCSMYRFFSVPCPVIYIDDETRVARVVEDIWDARGSFLLRYVPSAGSILLFFLSPYWALPLLYLNLSVSVCAPSHHTHTQYSNSKRRNKFFLHHFHTICLRIGFNVGADKSYIPLSLSISLVFILQSIKSAELWINV